MFEILWGLILMPFAAIAVVFTGALGVSVIIAIYKAIFKRNKN